MNKKLINWIIRIAILLLLAWFVGSQLHKAWAGVQNRNIAIDWRFGAISILGFACSMTTGALVWRWLARQMSITRAPASDSASPNPRGDSLPTLPLLGAYLFSQMGKYLFKVGLLLMRIERTGRFGMSAGLCTLSTLLENALYVISGGLVSAVAVFRILEELRAQGIINSQQQQWQWPLLLLAIAILAIACYPPVFYGAINFVIKRMKKPEISREQRLSMSHLFLAIVGFIPCWIFGGIALWASTMCVHEVDFLGCWWFAGAFALSVVMGMISLLPGGLGVREVVLGVAVTLQLTPAVHHDQAILLGSAVAVLQRLFQVLAEVLLCVTGALLTGGGKASKQV